MGYPTRYKSTGSANNMTWARDGRLTSYNYNGFNNAYKYDANGLRYKKTTSEGTKYHYYSENGDIIFEKINGTAIYYLYDMRGVAGMVCDGQTFYFRKNHLGDITAIIAQNGVLAATYTYDAWGNTAQVSYPAAIVGGVDIGIMNPWRYRSYYYDTESKLYYLQQRYYDPQVRRFISPDSLDLLPMLAGYVGQLNLYAYCNNNPVMFTDETGQIVFTLTTLLIIAAGCVTVGATAGGINAAIYGGNVWDGIWKGALIGGMIGLSIGLIGVGVFGFAGVAGVGVIKAGGLAASIAFGAGTTSFMALNSATPQNGRFDTMSIGEIGSEWVTGLAIGGISGAFTFGLSKVFLGSLGSQIGSALSQKGMMGLKFGQAFGAANMAAAGYWVGRGAGMLLSQYIKYLMNNA